MPHIITYWKINASFVSHSHNIDIFIAGWFNESIFQGFSFCFYLLSMFRFFLYFMYLCCYLETKKQVMLSIGLWLWFLDIYNKQISCTYTIYFYVLPFFSLQITTFIYVCCYIAWTVCWDRETCKLSVNWYWKWKCHKNSVTINSDFCFFFSF